MHKHNFSLPLSLQRVCVCAPEKYINPFLYARIWMSIEAVTKLTRARGRNSTLWQIKTNIRIRDGHDKERVLLALKNQSVFMYTLAYIVIHTHKHIASSSSSQPLRFTNLWWTILESSMETCKASFQVYYHSCKAVRYHEMKDYY